MKQRKPTTGKIDSFQTPTFWWFLLLDGGLGLLAAISLNDTAYTWFVRSVLDVVGAAFLFPRWLVRGIALAATVVHIAEAIFVFATARQVGMKRTGWLWTLQTLIVGFPSLMLFNAQRAKRNTGK
eukprot:TRINITY_DN15417_c0_g1_i1.p1 TRINITY_DN15417_c0_g1~~TRINITY_DN15417_c0_g1_i1.p1  ORF type:complete len:125 (+),score=22.22 TRINITY_DN15417_c0_g1_i1:69-443(+)